MWKKTDSPKCSPSTEKTNTKICLTSDLLTSETTLSSCTLENGYDVNTDMNYVEEFQTDHLLPLGMLKFVATSVLNVECSYAYQMLCFKFYLLWNADENSDPTSLQDPDVQIAIPTASTTASSLGNENSDELAINLNHIYAPELNNRA